MLPKIASNKRVTNFSKIPLLVKTVSLILIIRMIGVWIVQPYASTFIAELFSITWPFILLAVLMMISIFATYFIKQ